MIGRLLRWAGGLFLTVLVSLCLAVAWLLATERGARWVFAQASPYLPEALQVETVNGTIVRGLNFRGVSWDDTATRVRVADLQTTLDLMPLIRREVRIETLQLRGVEASIGARPATDADPDNEPFSIDLPIALDLSNASIENARITIADNSFVIEQIRLGAALSGSALTIRRFDLQSELADISLAGNAQLAGSYTADAHAAWELRLADQPPLSGILSLRGDATAYEIRHSLDAPYAIDTQGSVALVDSELFVDLANTWELVQIAAGDERVVDLGDGSLRVRGPMAALSVDARTSVLIPDTPLVLVDAHGKLGDDRMVFDDLSIVNEWGRLTAKGELMLSPEVSWNFDFGLSDIDPASVDPRLTGKLQANGSTSGRIVDQRPRLQLTLDGMSGNLNGYPVEGSGSFSYASQELVVDSGTARVGNNRVDFNGSFGRQLLVDARVRFSDLRQFGLGAAGLLNADVRVASDLQTYEASGYVSGAGLSWNQYAVDTLEAKFDLPAARAGTMSIRLASEEYGSLAAEMDGRFLREQWSGTVTELKVSREPAGEWTLQESADILLSRSELKLRRFCLGSTAVDGIACAAIDYDFSGPIQFEASIDALPVAALPRRLPEGATIRGMIGAAASGSFADGRFNAEVSLAITDLGLVASYEGEEVAANFDKAAARATVVDNRLAGEFEFRLDNTVDYAAGSVEIADLFDQNSALLGRASLEFNDLALLSFFVPDLANPAGRIFGSVEAIGSLVAPEIAGEIGLMNGSVDIRRAGISITEAALVLRQRQSGQLALEGRAKSGDGYLGITGDTTLNAETGIRTEVRLDGDNFSLLRLPDWQVTASPKITVVFDERVTRVSGEIVIPQANIAVKNLPETAEKPSPDAVVHREDDAIRRPQRVLYVDLTTVLGDRVLFSGFGLTTGLEGSVRINGDSNSTYRSFGRVVLREGRYQAYGQNLAIERGELVFGGPLGSPALNVRATRTASDNTVAGIHLTGTPTQLRSEVYSEPPLGDAEALSYLLTGRPLSSADSSEGDMLNQAAFALGLTTAGSVASRIRNQLGFETLGFQGGAENRQFVAGKRFGERLFVEYAYGVVDSLGTLLLRYQLTRRLMVESRSGSVRNVDVVYSVKKR